MKKIFSKLLLVAMVVVCFNCTVFAGTIQSGSINIGNVIGASETTYYTDDYGNDIMVYVCEDYATITTNEDVAWVQFTYFYDYDYSFSVEYYTEDPYGDPLMNYMSYLTVDNKIWEFDAYITAMNNGTVEYNSDFYINADSQYDILCEGIYIVDIYGIDGWQEMAMVEVMDTDGVATYDEYYSSMRMGTAQASSCTVLVDGEQVAFEAYEINGNNFFKLRDIAAALSSTDKKFGITWYETSQVIAMSPGSNYTEVGGELEIGDGTDKMYVSSPVSVFKKYEQLYFKGYAIDGNNYFKLREVCMALDVGVGWDEATQTITIDTSIGYTG